jgi:hypothetical protein
VPGRRYGDFVELLEPIHSKLCANAKEEVLAACRTQRFKNLTGFEIA